MGISHHLVLIISVVVFCIIVKKRINVSVLLTTIRLALINYI